MMPRLAALLRTDLRYFIQRVFAFVFPGTEYLHGWHVDAIVFQLMPSTPAIVVGSSSTSRRGR